MPASILIVDDEKHTREGLSLALSDKYETTVACDAEEAFRLLDADVYDVVLTDLRMAGKSGLSVIDYAVKKANHPICIMMTAYGSVETAVEAMKRGAYDFLTKPVSLEKLEMLIERAFRERKLVKENVELHSRLDRKYRFEGMIGNSPKLINVIDAVKQVATTKATILITGETGTGKELIAQMIHQNSPRAQHPFVTVHCAAISSNLLESELFGHEKGSFTGAYERRIGRFESANEGTIFLDEVGEIDLPTQVKLLRFLETKSFERVGSSKSMTVDVRLLCATHRDLKEMVKKGTFREDLYYRLNVVEIKLPPLRERTEDIPVLLDHFVKYFCKENKVEPVRFSNDALDCILKYPWPGNIRELRNFCENMVVLHHGKEVTQYYLGDRFKHGEGFEPASDERSEGKERVTAKKKSLSKEENEKQLIHSAMIESKGKRGEAAELLGISRRTLHRKLQQWPELDV